jgi:long-chain acyl-CoA synthetase
MADVAGEWTGGWEADARRQREAWLRTTPLQRLEWLEAAIAFAAHDTPAHARPGAASPALPAHAPPPRRPPLTTGPNNLARVALESLERNGDRDALFADGTWHRAAALQERATRLAAGLRARGIQPGDRVCVFMANCAEVGVAYTGIWHAGAAATPAVFLLPAPELHHVLSHSGSRAVLTTPELLHVVREAARGTDAENLVVCVGSETADGVTAWADLESAEPAPLEPRGDDDLAALMYTGGTTGRSKGVMLSHANLSFCAAAAEEASYVPGLTRTLVPLPLSHAYGLALTVIAMHAREPSSTVLMRWFEPKGFLELAAEHRVHRAAVVPSMLQMLLAHLEDVDLSALRYVSCGGAPLAPELVAEFERRVPGVQVNEGYGCTESGGIITTNPPGARRLGTVGRALPGYEVRIAPVPDAGLADGDGEVVCRSPGVMQGYYASPEATAATLRDGWLHTGDIGRIDADGYLTLVDRVKDLIIRGGFNVYPRDVEDALAEHPEIAAAGVVGRPDDRVGEEVVAFVAPVPGATPEPEAVVVWSRERLGPKSAPREVVVLDALPLTPVGKLDRKALRARLGGVGTT